MIQTHFPIQIVSILIPLIGSFLFPLLGRRLKIKKLSFVSFLLLLVPLISFSGIILKFGLGEGVADPVFFSQRYIGSFSMLLDSLSMPFVLGIAIVTALVALYSAPYMKHRIREMKAEGLEVQSPGTFFMLYTMFSASMIGIVLSTNLIEFYIFLELSLIPSFLLISFFGYGDRIRIAFMYLLWTHIGALVFLLGILYLGLTTGTFNILNIQNLTINLGLGQGLPILVLIAIVIGLLVKMATFGVHIWLPYAHAEAPTPVSALLSPNLIGISGYALVRIAYGLFPAQFAEISLYLLALAFLTAIYGGLMALAQDDFKRLLAYSSISQMGWILLGISTLTPDGITGAMLLFLSHAFGKSILFMSAGVLIVRFDGLRSISKMGGLVSKVPIFGGLVLLGFMFIVGLPPTLGIWSKILIVIGAFNMLSAMGTAAFALLALGLIVAAGLTATYSFVTLKEIFLGELPRGLKKATVGCWSTMTIVMGIVALVGIAFFFYPSFIIDPLKDLISNILV